MTALTVYYFTPDYGLSENEATDSGAVEVKQDWIWGSLKFMSAKQSK